MDNLYARYDEKFIKNSILYAQSEDDYIYTSEDCDEDFKVDKDTLIDLCKKSQVIILYDGTTYCVPIAFKEASGAVEVTVVTAISTVTSTTTITHVTLYSKEHVSE